MADAFLHMVLLDTGTMSRDWARHNSPIRVHLTAGAAASVADNAPPRCSASCSHGANVKTFTAVIERDTQTGLLVGYIPGFRGAHSQAATMEELEANLAEVVAMLLEDGEPNLETEFVGTQTVRVA